MKSKKIHKVILKTPILRHIRNNLRLVLKLAVKEELQRLSRLKTLYFNKKNLTPSQKRRKAHLRREWNNLNHSFRRSTLECGNGITCILFQEGKGLGVHPQDGPTNLDLIWIPWLERWFCVECFETYGYGEMTHEDFDDPMYREWVKSEFGI